MTDAPQSCGAKCARTFGEHGEIAHVRLTEADVADLLVVWRGFQVLARLCGHHQKDASHDLTHPGRDGRRFTVGALVGRKTVADLCEKRK